jgi:tight adherence protein B
MSKNEQIFNTAIAAVVIFAVGMIFYQRIILALILALLSLKFPKIRTAQIIKSRKNMLNSQFKDLLYSLSSSMVAGRSLASAFSDAVNDMQVLYPDPDIPIMQETRYIVRQLEMGENVEEAIAQFAERAHLDDITNFADVIKTCNRSGGNLIDVVRNTSQIISDKIETKNEIEISISGKKFESRILCAMPIVMVLILSLSSPDYMSPVFHTIPGAFVMTVAVIMFVLAFFVGEKIMDIEV